MVSKNRPRNTGPQKIPADMIGADAVEVGQHQSVSEEDRVIEEGLRRHQNSNRPACVGLPSLLAPDLRRDHRSLACAASRGQVRPGIGDHFTPTRAEHRDCAGKYPRRPRPCSPSPRRRGFVDCAALRDGDRVPGIAVGRVQPAAAEIERAGCTSAGGPGTAAEPRPRFHNQAVDARVDEPPACRDSGRAAADDALTAPQPDATNYPPARHRIPGDIMSERRATSSRNARATSSESAPMVPSPRSKLPAVANADSCAPSIRVARTRKRLPGLPPHGIGHLCGVRPTPGDTPPRFS